MGHEHIEQGVTDEDRREFLKALGIAGTVGVGGMTLNEVRNVVSTTGAAEELAPVGRAIKADLAGALDVGLIASQQEAFAEAVSALPAVVDEGLPGAEPREDFQAVADAGRPVYEHLQGAGFFESTTSHLPEFTPKYITQSAELFVGTESIAEPLKELGITDEVGLDLVVPVVNQADDISEHHWLATDMIPREQIEYGEHIPAMTSAAAGGSLLWLEDLDLHLWQDKILISDEILNNAVWDTQGMAAGFHLMAEGAKVIGEESDELSNEALGALLSTSFAMQTIAQWMLIQDAYWITEEMRAPRGEKVEKLQGLIQ